ncbi:MAG: aromatic amino acid transport family protein [Candidatus Pacebacteria bacterium]|nr:aromatic amino acid transport family protein [Candidatus Paceibacterota bacterium]
MKYLRGIGIIVGLMFGAGIFALPYTVLKSGVLWGLIHFFVALFLIIFLHLLYAEISFRAGDGHRFVGYVRMLLGEKYKSSALFITLASYYGTLLAYGVLGGIFLSNFFEEKPVFFATLAFFVFGSLFLLLKMGNIAFLNFCLSIPLFVFVVILAFLLFPSFDTANFHLLPQNEIAGNSNWFLPYGVWIFALSALAVIPDARDLFRSSSVRNLKRVVLASIFLCAAAYLLFTFAVLGSSGLETSDDALSGLSGILGSKIILAGSIMGFLAVFTSFLALGFDLLQIFRFDFKISKTASWFLAIAPPLLFFLLGFHNFGKIIGVVGTIGIGFTGFLVILMGWKSRKNFWIAGVLASLAIFAAVAYEVFNIFF